VSASTTSPGCEGPEPARMRRGSKSTGQLRRDAPSSSAFCALAMRRAPGAISGVRVSSTSGESVCGGRSRSCSAQPVAGRGPTKAPGRWRRIEATRTCAIAFATPRRLARRRLQGGEAGDVITRPLRASRGTNARSTCGLMQKLAVPHGLRLTGPLRCARNCPRRGRTSRLRHGSVRAEAGSRRRMYRAIAVEEPRPRLRRGHPNRS